MAKAPKAAAAAPVDKKAAKAAVPEVKKEKKSKKAKKEPTPPPPPSESESDSDEEESSDEDESADEAEFKPDPAVVKATEAELSADSDSDESSDEEEAKPAVAAKANGAAAAESDSDSDEDSSDDEEAAKPAAAEGSDDSSSDDEDDEEEEEKAAKPAATNGNTKRKADEATEAPTKKAKTFAEDENPASTNVFVGQLSWNVDNDWLSSEFASCGEIVSARVVTDRETQRSRGFGYVQFADLEAAAKALELDGKEMDGRNIRVNYAAERQERGDNANAERRAKTFGDKQNPPADTLWVGSLSFDATEDNLYEAFGDFGDIQRVSLPTDRETGAPKGFGYVQYGDVAHAQAALTAMNGTEIAGRTIRVDFAPPKNNDNAGGGRGGGRGGFGGGRGGGRGGFGGDRGGRGGGRGGFGGRGGGRGGFGDRGGRGRGAPRGGARTGGIVPGQGSKVTFD